MYARRQEQSKKNEALLVAIERDKKIDIKRVKSLLDNKANPDIAILYAVRTGRVDIVNELLEAKADVNLRSRVHSTPLHNAAEHPSEEMIERLLTAKAQINSKRKGKKGLLYQLKKAAGDDLSEYGDKATPLHLAAEQGHSGVVNVLLKHKADINIKNVKGERAFQCALHSDDAETIRALLEAKACSHSIRSREFALMDAVFENNPGAVHALLASKVNPNLPHCQLPQERQTLLSIAIGNEDYLSALSLVKANAKIPRKDVLKEQVLELIENDPEYAALYNAGRAPGTVAAVLAAFHPRLGKTSPIKTACGRSSLGEPKTMLLPLRLAGVPVNQYARIKWFSTPELGLQTGSETSIAPVALPPPHVPLTHQAVSSSSAEVAAPESNFSEEEPLIMLP